MNHLPIIDLEATGQKLEKLRIEHHISVRELQEYLGLASVQAVYKWQCGKSLPTVDNLLALAVLFNLHIEDLLAYTGQEIPFLKGCLCDIRQVFFWNRRLAFSSFFEKMQGIA